MTTKNTTIQIRIDETTKKRSRKIFKALGLDMSTGIDLFLKAVIREEGIPFDIETSHKEVNLGNRLDENSSNNKKDTSGMLRKKLQQWYS